MAVETRLATPTPTPVGAAPTIRRRSAPTYYPTFDQFRTIAAGHDLAPVWRELPADIDTPVSVMLRLRGAEGHAPSFLFESVERGEAVGRYSFIGFRPSMFVETRENSVTVYGGGQPVTTRAINGDPLEEARALLGGRRCARVPALPSFLGGAVGFLGWDAVQFFERLPKPSHDALELPDSGFMLIDTLIAFDHVQRRMKLITLADVANGSLERAYANAVDRIETLHKLIRQPLPELPEPPGAIDTPTTSNFSQAEFEARVSRAKEYIVAGDAFQIVPSQRRQRPTQADALSIYRALRMINPSPYMFFLDFGRYQLIGSSPEMQVRLIDGHAEMRPIAGTYPRGKTAEEDDALAAALLNDIKERAEHVMLVDLARNDLGRVCAYGSVRVPSLMTVERFSHVMHIVSEVEGQLAPDKDAFDLVRATFPAGTLSGAPKIRAIEIITELEDLKRGAYGGIVGYFGFDGNVDTCITIRTVVLKDGVASMQAGGGVVADSNPTTEYHESMNKLAAVERALATAENGLE